MDAGWKMMDCAPTDGSDVLLMLDEDVHWCKYAVAYFDNEANCWVHSDTYDDVEMDCVKFWSVIHPDPK